MQTNARPQTSDTHDRVSRLRDEMRALSPQMCIERALLLTESYKQTESEPAVLRRARSLTHILANIGIRIDDTDMIVGAATSKRVAGPMLPEVQWQWLMEEMDTLAERDYECFQPLTAEEQVKAREMLAYWENRSLFDKWAAITPQDSLATNWRSWGIGGANPHVGMHQAHYCPGYERVLAKGMRGIKAEVAAALAKLDLADPKDYGASIFYRAVDITLDGVMDFAVRYAVLAQGMAVTEADPARKSELETIAVNCGRVPADPPTGFWDALQSVWFTYVALMLEGWGPGIAFGRMDQYLYPFYKRDLEAGRTTRESAAELIELFYVKLNELLTPFRAAQAAGSGQIPLSVVTLGGIDRNGNNAVNELSYLFLDAEQSVRLQEDLAVRIHSSTPESFVVKACETAKLVRGKIKFVSDETITQQLIKDGKPIQDARDYGVAGCFIRTVPGRSFDPGADFLNLPMMLEFALNNGVSRLGGDRIGLPTGDVRDFQAYNDVWNAYKKQVGALVRQRVIETNTGRQMFAEMLPAPLQSSLYESCIDSGIDVMAGGVNPYTSMNFWVCGIPNVGDSLAVIKKLVFEDKKVTLSRLNEALEKDFDGEDELLHFISRVPKFGNDDDYVDSLVNEVLIQVCDEAAKYVGYSGYKYTVAAGAIGSNLPFGAATGALPDGRKAGEPLSEGGISPHQGRNICGPTATMRSVAKLDLARASGGAVLNMRFHPDCLKDEMKMRKFAQMLKTYCATGGDLVQFNIVSSEMLRDAQREPEKYRDLLVRVATYSAYFVDIPVEMQNDIIARTEFQEL